MILELKAGCSGHTRALTPLPHYDTRLVAAEPGGALGVFPLRLGVGVLVG
jgi:hypothetical protein